MGTPDLEVDLVGARPLAQAGWLLRKSDGRAHFAVNAVEL